MNPFSCGKNVDFAGPGILGSRAPVSCPARQISNSHHSHSGAEGASEGGLGKVTLVSDLSTCWDQEGSSGFGPAGPRLQKSLPNESILICEPGGLCQVRRPGQVILHPGAFTGPWVTQITPAWPQKGTSEGVC